MTNFYILKKTSLGSNSISCREFREKDETKDFSFQATRHTISLAFANMTIISFRAHGIINNWSYLKVHITNSFVMVYMQI